MPAMTSQNFLKPGINISSLYISELIRHSFNSWLIRTAGKNKRLRTH